VGGETNVTTTRRVLAGAALVLGAIAPFAGSPYPSPSMRADVRSLAAEVMREEDHVTAIELAAWIRDRQAGLRVVDLRSPEEFDEYHVPGAEQMSLDSLVRARFQPGETIVLYSQGGAHSAQGWVFLRAAGHEHVYFLRGGLDEWIEDVMSPALPLELTPESERRSALSRYFGGVPRRGGGETKTSVEEIRRRGC
jgi:rhodanese-related sulfurtransferase